MIKQKSLFYGHFKVPNLVKHHACCISRVIEVVGMVRVYPDPPSHAQLIGSSWSSETRPVWVESCFLKRFLVSKIQSCTCPPPVAIMHHFAYKLAYNKQQVILLWICAFLFKDNFRFKAN